MATKFDIFGGAVIDVGAGGILHGKSDWCSVLVHIQDLEVDAAFNLGILRNRRLRSLMIAIERRVLQSFDRVSTISPQMRRRLELKGVEAAKLREIRNWIDLVNPFRGSAHRSEKGIKVRRFQRNWSVFRDHVKQARN